jgi:hypothetical protein
MMNEATYGPRDAEGLHTEASEERVPSDAEKAALYWLEGVAAQIQALNDTIESLTSEVERLTTALRKIANTPYSEGPAASGLADIAERALT